MTEESSEFSDKNDLFETIVEHALYAPLGALFRLKEEYPSLSEVGHQYLDEPIRNARVIGEAVVQMGNKDLKRRFSELIHNLFQSNAQGDSAVYPFGNEQEGEPTKASAVIENGNDGSKTGHGTSRPRPMHQTTPNVLAQRQNVTGAISKYDTLSASQVVRRLDGLDEAQLKAVKTYEAATRRRRTILTRAETLLSADLESGTQSAP